MGPADKPGLGRYHEVLNRRVSSLKCGKPSQAGQIGNLMPPRGAVERRRAEAA
jgi:hypothetical protein